MKFRVPLSLLLSAALALPLAGCGREAPPPPEPPPAAESSRPAEETRTESFALAVLPGAGLHPVLCGSRINLGLSPLLYEPLFQLDGRFEARPVLCARYTVSPDKLVWTFTLRSDPVFSDGTPLTGQAAADALELARGAGSRFAPRLAGIRSVEAQGQDLTITLRQPNGRLPLLLDIPIALGSGDTPPGTGPYVPAGPEEAPRLDARPDWWQHKKLPASSLPLRPVRDTDGLSHAFAAGEVSLVDADLAEAGVSGCPGNSEIRDYPTSDLLFLGFNTRRGFCRSTKARSAVSEALDRDALARTAWAGRAVPAVSPFHPACGLAPGEDLLSGGPEETGSADRRVSPAGQPPVLLVSTESAAKLQAAQLIAQQLESAGIPVRVRKLDFTRYLKALQDGNFDFYLGETVLTADFDLRPLLAPDGALNYGGWKPLRAPELLDSLAAAGTDEAPGAAESLLELLTQDPPFAPICFKNGSVLTRWGMLSGLSPVRGNIFYCLEDWSIRSEK